jgi:hypothetical protein
MAGGPGQRGAGRAEAAAGVDLPLAITLPLPPGHPTPCATLSARILDVRTHEPVPGAILHLSGVAERFTTDADGRAALEVPLGHYLLTVMRPGYRRL